VREDRKAVVVVALSGQQAPTNIVGCVLRNCAKLAWCDKGNLGFFSPPKISHWRILARKY